MHIHPVSILVVGVLFSPCLSAGTWDTAANPLDSAPGAAAVSGAAPAQFPQAPSIAPTRLSQADVGTDAEQAQQDYLESVTREAVQSDRAGAEQSSSVAESVPAASEPAPAPRAGARRFDAIRDIVSEALAEPEADTATRAEPVKKTSAPVAKRRERLEEVVTNAPPPKDSPGDNYISVLKDEVSTTVVVTPLRTSTAERAPGSAAPDARQTYVYTVRNGDSLWTIAKRVYGDGYLWAAIYDANRDRIADANVLLVGQRLEIPKN